MPEAINGHQISGQDNVLVGLSLAAVGVIAPLGNIVDPAVGGNQKVINGVHM